MKQAISPLPDYRAQRRTVRIDLSGSRAVPSYDIVVGDGLLSEAGEAIRACLGTRRLAIVTDSNVGPLYLKQLEAVLTAAGHQLLPSLTIPAGEASKDYATLQRLLDHLLLGGVDRKTAVVALGGGVIGDLAGVAASLALRGLDSVQIPTTLLSQVDSSVGGKNGINTAAGKNTVGTFYQPRLVLADVALLDSLPHREMLAGYAEVVKYGLIKDPAFFQWCAQNAGKMLNGDREAQIYAIETCCAHKAQIVAADEREAGERALLNLGHTFGHALEASTGYGTLLLHGEAVAIGMAMAFELSVRLGLCAREEAEQVQRHLDGVGLLAKPPAFPYVLDSLMQLMAQDKKAIAGKLTLILARGIGRAFISHDVDTGKVREIWNAFLPVAES